jgi:hypothetical protein
VITEGICNSAKANFLMGTHAQTDVFKLALFSAAAEIGPSSTNYSAAGEIKGEGYEAGGTVLEAPTVVMETGEAALYFYDAVWKQSEIKASGAMLYNSSKGDIAIAVYKFAREFASDGGEFRVTPGAVVLG